MIPNPLYRNYIRTFIPTIIYIWVWIGLSMLISTYTLLNFREIFILVGFPVCLYSFYMSIYYSYLRELDSKDLLFTFRKKEDKFSKWFFVFIWVIILTLFCYLYFFDKEIISIRMIFSLFLSTLFFGCVININRNYFDIDKFDLIITDFGIEFKQKNQTFEIKWEKMIITEFIKKENSIYTIYNGLIFDKSVKLELNEYDTNVQIQIVEIFKSHYQKFLNKNLELTIG